MTIDQTRQQHYYGTAFVAMLAALPVVCVIAPRFAGIGPVLLALLFMVTHVAIFRRWPMLHRRAIFWALLFPGLMALSALWGIDPAQSFDRAVRTLPVTVGGAVLFSLVRGLDEPSKARFTSYFFAGVFLAGVFCAVELYSGARAYFWLNESFNPDKKFNFSRLNRSIAVFTLCAIPALYCVQHFALSAQQKWMRYMLLAVLLAVVLGTRSQSVQLAAIFAAAFFVLFPLVFQRTKMPWVVLTGLMAAALLATPWMVQFLFSHAADAIAHHGWFKSSYMPHRLEIWDFVSRRALEYPWLGHGAEATRVITDFDSAKLYHPTTEVLHPHNFAVQVWMEFGLLGAAWTAVFLGDVLRTIRQAPPQAGRYMLAAFIACISIAATGYGIWQSWWLGMFVLLLSFFAAAPAIQNQSDKR